MLNLDAILIYFDRNIIFEDTEDLFQSSCLLHVQSTNIRLINFVIELNFVELQSLKMVQNDKLEGRNLLKFLTDL